MKRNLSNRIIKAVNKGLNEALLDLIDDEEDDSLYNTHSHNISQQAQYHKDQLEFEILIDSIKEKSVYSLSEKTEFLRLYKEHTYKANNDNLRALIKITISICASNQVDLNWIDTSEVTSMKELFENSLFNGDISRWDTSNVKDMCEMFCDSQFNGDISKWNTSNVTDMSYMFDSAKFNGDISNWDTSNVTNMSGMFCESIFNQDISRWDTSKVKDISYMFYRSNFNQDISKWDVSNIQFINRAFNNSCFSQDISNWDLHIYNNSVFDHCPIQYTKRLPKSYQRR